MMRGAILIPVMARQPVLDDALSVSTRREVLDVAAVGDRRGRPSSGLANAGLSRSVWRDTAMLGRGELLGPATRR